MDLFEVCAPTPYCDHAASVKELHSRFVPIAAVVHPLIEVADDTPDQVCSRGWTGQTRHRIAVALGPGQTF